MGGIPAPGHGSRDFPIATVISAPTTDGRGWAVSLRAHSPDALWGFNPYVICVSTRF